MKKILMVLVGLVLATTVYGEEKEQLPKQGSNKIKKIDKILEKDFGGIIERIIPHYPEKIGDTNEIIYPKVITTRGAVKYLNKDGTVKKEIKIPYKKGWVRSGISENGEYFCITDGSMFERILGTVKILNKNGEIIWQGENVLQKQYIPNNGNGMIAVGVKPKLAIDFYDENFKVIKSYDLGWGGGLEHSIISPLGNIFVTSYMGNVGDDKKPIWKNYLVAYDLKGNELWRKENKTILDESQREITKDGKYIIILGILYQSDGKEVVVSPDTIWCYFSPDENYVIGVNKKLKEIYLYGIKEMKILQTIPLKKDMELIKIWMANKSEVIALYYEKEKSRVFSIDKDGRIIDEKTDSMVIFIDKEGKLIREEELIGIGYLNIAKVFLTKKFMIVNPYNSSKLIYFRIQ